LEGGPLVAFFYIECSELLRGLRSRLTPRQKDFIIAGIQWLGRQDSNLGMPVPKTGALPLGDAPPELESGDPLAKSTPA
jgi:hypothetical protein